MGNGRAQLILDLVLRLGFPAAVAGYLLVEFRSTLDRLALLIERSIAMQELLLRILQSRGAV